MMPRRSFIIAMLAIAWLGIPQSGWSQGTIAYFQPPSPVILYTDGFAQFYPLDFDGDGSAEFTFAYNFQFLGVRSEEANRILIGQDPPPNVGGPIAPLSGGSSIGTDSELGTLRWSSGFGDDFETLGIYFNTGTGGAFVGQQAYMAVEFQTGGGSHYGWISLYVNPVAPVGVIDSWAWETRPGVPILAGAVPEPSALALLSVAGIVLLTLRWRRVAGLPTSR